MKMLIVCLESQRASRLGRISPLLTGGLYTADSKDGQTCFWWKQELVTCSSIIQIFDFKGMQQATTIYLPNIKLSDLLGFCALKRLLAACYLVQLSRLGWCIVCLLRVELCIDLAAWFLRPFLQWMPFMPHDVNILSSLFSASLCNCSKPYALFVNVQVCPVFVS